MFQRIDTEPFDIVELRIESNHGNMEYTCLYRFRVHGTLAPQWCISVRSGKIIIYFELILTQFFPKLWHCDTEREANACHWSFLPAIVQRHMCSLSRILFILFLFFIKTPSAFCDVILEYKRRLVRGAESAETSWQLFVFVCYSLLFSISNIINPLMSK